VQPKSGPADIYFSKIEDKNGNHCKKRILSKDKKRQKWNHSSPLTVKEFTLPAIAPALKMKRYDM
jgi:hypothetical protein